MVPTGVGLLQRFAKFNGGFSKEQLDWLDSLLSVADAKGERVTLVCEYNHFVSKPLPSAVYPENWQQCRLEEKKKADC